MIYKPKIEKEEKIEIRMIALIKIQISYFPTKKFLNSFNNNQPKVQVQETKFTTQKKKSEKRVCCLQLQLLSQV